MKRNAVIGLVAGALVIILAWYLVIYSPKNDELSKAEAQLTTEQKTTQDLEAELARLQEQQKNATEQAAELDKFDAAIPELPDLAEFIIQANDIADESGIEFMTIAPAPPVATGTTATIGLTITVTGGFFQVKDYLSKLENLPRLVIVDGINLSSGGDTTSADTTSSSDGFSLSVNITGRMFTRALPTAVDASGAVPPPADPGTSSTTAPSGGSTSSSTVPAGSSTTGGV